MYVFYAKKNEIVCMRLYFHSLGVSDL